MMLRASRRPIAEDGGWLGTAPDAPRADPSNRRRLLVFLRHAARRARAEPRLCLASSGRVSLGRARRDRAGRHRGPWRAQRTRPDPRDRVRAAVPHRIADPDESPGRCEEVAARLAQRRRESSPFGPDPIAGIQSHLEAVPVEKTNVVELIATGPSAGVLAPVVNTTIDVYRERLAQSYQASSSEALADADDEVKRLEQLVVATTRRDLEAFRLRHNIVSLERDENQVLAQVRNLGTSLSVANEKVAAAEGKLRALTESAAAGNAVARSRDDPTLGDLEQRASQARVELRDMERVYTQDYPREGAEGHCASHAARRARAPDPVAARGEPEGGAGRGEGRARSATSAATRLQSQTRLRPARKSASSPRVSTNTSRVRTTSAEIEKTFREATQKRARLEASERSRMPAANSSKRPARRREPWRPLYWRDTGDRSRRLAPAGAPRDVARRALQSHGAAARGGGGPAAAGRDVVRRQARRAAAAGRARSSRWAARSLRCWPRSRSCRASSIAPTWRGCCRPRTTQAGSSPCCC